MNTRGKNGQKLEKRNEKPVNGKKRGKQETVHRIIKM